MLFYRTFYASKTSSFFKKNKCRTMGAPLVDDTMMDLKCAHFKILHILYTGQKKKVKDFRKRDPSQVSSLLALDSSQTTKIRRVYYQFQCHLYRRKSELIKRDFVNVEESTFQCFDARRKVWFLQSRTKNNITLFCIQINIFC